MACEALYPTHLLAEFEMSRSLTIVAEVVTFIKSHAYD